MEASIRPAGHLYKTQWKMPLLCALSLHLFVFGGSIYAPEIFKTKPKFAKIQMVSLVNLAPPAPSKTSSSAPSRQKPATPPPAKQPQPKPPPAKKEVTAKPVAPVKKAAKKIEKPVVDDAPTKTISVNPKKKKIKKIAPAKEKPKTKPKPDLKKLRAEKERAQRKAQEIAQRLKKEALLEKEAQLAAERAKLAQQALEKERALLEDFPDIPPARRLGQTGSPVKDQEQERGSSSRSNVIADQYYSTVAAIIGSRWALPPDLEKQAQLRATAVIKVDRNGRIVGMFFEEKSTNTMFNQFVVNTINASNPLPPIPAALNKQEIEFGMKFSREGVH